MMTAVSCIMIAGRACLEKRVSLADMLMIGKRNVLIDLERREAFILTHESGTRSNMAAALETKRSFRKWHMKNRGPA